MQRWKATYQLDQEARVVSVTVSAGKPARGPWSAIQDFVNGVAVEQDLGEAAGLTSELLRKLRPGRAVHVALSYLPGEWSGVDQSTLRRQATGSDRLHAEAATAELYVKALKAESRTPVADVALTLRQEPEQVRDRLHRARRDGLLTPAGRGRAGGTLTQAAFDLLREGEPR